MADFILRSNRENSVKMVLNPAPAAASASTINAGLPSPTGETLDENSSKLISYLHQLAGNYEIEVDVIMKDHCYARPWNWKPENIYVKPVKKLFFTKTPIISSKDISSHQEINVDDVDPEASIPPYDLSKVRQAMDEFQRVANFVRSEDVEDWEEKIDKILWSPVQNRIFNRIVRILNSERVARLTKSNSVHEPILRRTSIDMTAKRFRETLASANWDWRITQWLHSLLFDFLPQDYLAIYLDILQTLRQKVPQLIDKMIAVQPNINSKGSNTVSCLVNWETLAPLLKKTWDPVGPILNASKPKKLPGNPILIIVPNGLSSNLSSRMQKWIAQLGILGTVVPVNPHLGLTANRMTVLTGVEQLVQASRAKIQDVRVDFPGRPIILVGFNTGAALACQISLIEHITATVCLGFPFNTVDGKRGSPDDSLMDVRCPVMFVIGQNSMLARVDEIEDLRERMLVLTSLVVVGSADDHLRISTSKKISEKISQSMVDRCVLDEIADFVGSILVQPHPLPLRPHNTVNNYESRTKRGDTRKRKNSTSSSVDSEPQSPNIKKLRPQSPLHATVVGNNVSGIATNVLPRGTLVTITGTTATQTPRRKSRGSYSNHNFSDQLITSRLTPQQQNLDNQSGGITLNIGSFASLAPVGPIRFESSSINLQTPQSGKTTTNTIKTSNAFIKVSKNNQVNITGPQNLAKIKMIMPTKKIPQRPVNTYKNANLMEKNDKSMVNVVTPGNTPLRITAPTATVTNLKPIAGSSNMVALPSISVTKTSANAGTPLTNKTATSSSILFTPKNSSVATSTPTSTSSATSKVVDSCVPVVGGSRKHTIFRGCQQEHTAPGGGPVPLPCKPRSPKAGCAAPKISLKSLQRPSPQSQSSVQITDSNKINSRSTDTTQENMSGTPANASLDDDLGNILDIPIIIAKDGESLGSLSPLPPAGGAPREDRPSNASGSKVILINNKAVAPPTIKYTKIILTKRSDQDDKSAPVILTKAPRRSGNLVVVNPATRISTSYLAEIQRTASKSPSNAQNTKNN